MPLASLPELFPDPLPASWAVGCFSVYNLESINAVVRAAESEQTPAVLSIDGKAIEHVGFGPLAKACIQAAAESPIPLTVHLNHARSQELVQRGLDLGIPSIMFDGSRLEMEENMDSTAQAAYLSHSAGATLEGELGPLDTPDLIHAAGVFAKRTSSDYIAFSVPSNTSRSMASFDFSLLEGLKNQIRAPLVLHGASRLTAHQVIQALDNGVRKVNVHTELLRVYAQGILSSVKDTPNADPLNWLTHGSQSINAVVREKIRFFKNPHNSL